MAEGTAIERPASKQRLEHLQIKTKEKLRFELTDKFGINVYSTFYLYLDN